MPRIQVTQKPGQLYNLKQVLDEWKIPAAFRKNISEAWQCDIAPFAGTEAEQAHCLLDGQVFNAPEELASDVFAEVGDDGLEWICRQEWNSFDKPKISFVGGWGRPGTPLLNEKDYCLVNSFSELLASDRVLNLQMFHRDERLPRLPLKLKWPVKSLLDGEKGELGVPCDIATRLSKKTALTWWHLDDGGEFVYQVALPLKEEHMDGDILIGPTGRPVVKLFVILPKEGYDFASQDDTTNRTGRFTGLDIFDTPTEHLPTAPDGAPVLPKVTLALLEAGGPPLMMAPNIPHTVLSIQTCVMTEQRKCFKLFLDETLYFFIRASRWTDSPIFYQYLQKSLQDPDFIREKMVDVLEPILANPDENPGRRTRAYQSLRALSSAAGQQSMKPDAATVQRIEVLLAAHPVLPDDRARRQDRIIVNMSDPLPGIQAIPYDGKLCHSAFIHERGRPRWGPVRRDIKQAKADRKKMESARKDKTLNAALAEMRQNLNGSGGTGAGGA